MAVRSREEWRGEGGLAGRGAVVLPVPLAPARLHGCWALGWKDSRTAGQQDSCPPRPRSLRRVQAAAQQPLSRGCRMLRDTQPASPCIQQSASVSHSNAGETITNTQCRKLICRQTSVLITGKVKKKTLSASVRAPASSRS